MDDRTIASWRLHSLGLVGLRRADAVAVVDHLLCVQAENHSQASWAIADRTTGITFVEFDDAFDRGEILRTHVLRPTWHFVRPADIRWLLELTGPRVQNVLDRSWSDTGLDAATVERSLSEFDRATRTPRTRDQLSDLFAALGLPSSGMAFGHLLMYAELQGVICSGPVIAGRHSYARVADRAPGARVIDREEALAEIVLRYFWAHGPATERDLTYWATLTLTDVRTGLASVRGQLESFEYDGLTYYWRERPPGGDPTPRGHLLQTLDEYHNGYQASRHHLDAARVVPSGRRSNVGMALVDGQMRAGMRRSVNDDTVEFDLDPFDELSDDDLVHLGQAAGRYGAYLGLEPVLRIV